MRPWRVARSAVGIGERDEPNKNCIGVSCSWRCTTLAARVRSWTGVCFGNADESEGWLQLRPKFHGPLQRGKRNDVPRHPRIRYYREPKGLGFGTSGVPVGTFYHFADGG